MIVVDTSVISEAIKPLPSPPVLAWFDAQDASSLYLTSVTLAELWFGIGALPAGPKANRTGSSSGRAGIAIFRPHPVI